MALCLAPFLSKPFHIDDTVFLRIAEQIQSEALAPYEFQYNWFGSPHSMWIVTQHPPLHSYLLAVCGGIAGMHEAWLHACYLLVAVGCALLMYSLANRFCRHPLLATGLTVAAPAFLVSATNLMADVLLLFFWLLAIWLLVRSADASRPSGLWWAGLAASAAAMTKYYGVALVPLLSVDCVLRSRNFEKSIRDNSFFLHVFSLGLPVAVLTAWGLYARSKCGVFHPLGAASYAMHDKSLLDAQLVVNIGRTLSFFGGGLLWAVFALPLAVRLPRRLVLTTVMLTAAVVGGELLLSDHASLAGLGVWSLSWYVVAVLGGAAVLAAAVAGFRARPDADSLLLMLWCLGTLVFSACFNWTVNARVVLPALFPAAVLFVRWVESLDAPGYWLHWLRWSMAPTAAMALLVAWGDYEYARAGKSFAQTTVRKLKGRGETVYFAGHWGFQYYLEEEGALPLDYERPDGRPGVLVAFPAVNSSVYDPPVPTELVSRTKFKSTCGLHTMSRPPEISRPGRAGFYSSLWGPVPFNVFADRVVDEFVIRRVVAPHHDAPENP